MVDKETGQQGTIVDPINAAGSLVSPLEDFKVPLSSSTRPPGGRRITVMGSRVAIPTGGRSGKTKEPMYPIFSAVAEQCKTVDNFWSRFFFSMSYGRFPKGVTLRDDYLCTRSKKQSVTLSLNKANLENWETVADFFRNACGIHSDRDWSLKKDVGKVIVELTTTQISQRLRRSCITTVPEFVIGLASKYSLIPSEICDTENLVKYYILMKLYRSGDVVYGPNGAIVEIKTLRFNPETRQFNFTHPLKEPRCAGRESYPDVVEFFSMDPSAKIYEKSTGFDEEILKQLKALYGRHIAPKTSSVGGRSQGSRRGARASRVQGDEETVADSDDTAVCSVISGDAKSSVSGSQRPVKTGKTRVKKPPTTPTTPGSFCEGQSPLQKPRAKRTPRGKGKKASTSKAPPNPASSVVLDEPDPLLYSDVDSRISEVNGGFDD